MFDLFRSRDKAVRYLLSALLVLVAASMVTYLIPGSGPGSGVDASDYVLAKIGDEKLTVHEVRQALSMAQRGRSLTPEMMKFVAPQLIDQLITERSVVYAASQMGFQVTDLDTANSIRQQLPQLFQNGQFVGKEVYAQVLSQQNMTITDFEDYMRRQLLLNRLRSVVLESIVVSSLDVEQEFRLRNEKASVEYVKLDPEQFRAKAEVSIEEMKDHYAKNKAAFKMGAKRGYTLLVVDPAKQEEAVAVSDIEVTRTYNENKDRFRVPERVKVRHILISTQDKPKEEADKAEKKAEDLLKQLKGGANFGDLAKKNSDDPGTKDKGGDLGFIERGRTVPEFETMAFTQKPGELSAKPIKTQYGFHILQVQEKQEARLRPFEEVKAELATEIKRQRAADRQVTLLDDVLRALKKNPAQSSQVAQQFNLEVVEVEKAGAGDPVPALGVSRDFEDAVRTLRKGEVSAPVQAPGNRAVIAIVKAEYPERTAEFEEVQNTIRVALAGAKAARMAAEKTDALAKKVQETGGDLKKAAQALGLTVTTSQEFSRNGAIEGLGAADSIPDLFTKPVGSAFGPIPVGTARVMGKIVSRKEADLSQLPAQQTALRDEIKSKRARERNSLFEAGLRQQLEREGKLKINKDALQRMVASAVS